MTVKMALVESTVAGRQANVRKRSLKVSVSADVKIQTIDGNLRMDAQTDREALFMLASSCATSSRSSLVI